MRNQDEKRRRLRKRIFAAVFATLLFLIVVFSALEIGVIYTGSSWEHWYADYEKEDIGVLLTKESLTEDDYGKLYAQTGLTRLAVDDMRDTVEGRERILDIQNAFFRNYEVQAEWFAPFTYTDKIDGRSRFCDLQDGDIIVTAAVRVSWWRYGHACIVINGELGQIAEAMSPATRSEISTLRTCEDFANFLVLRPKADKATKAEIVTYVQEEMLGLPYRFTVGILSKKYTKTLKTTQCAHFTWYAYKKFGVDLDSNGGGLVKPQDIALSDKVELVQAFGFNLEKLWS